jgi:hypothetical protein
MLFGDWSNQWLPTRLRRLRPHVVMPCTSTNWDACIGSHRLLGISQNASDAEVVRSSQYDDLAYLICVSDDVRGALDARQLHKMCVLRNSIDVQMFYRDEAARVRIRDEIGFGDRRVVLWCGRLSEHRKRRDILCRVIESSPPNLHFLVLGYFRENEPGQAEWQAFVDQQPNVTWISGLRHWETPAYYSAADLYLSTSGYSGADFEGLSLAAVQALAAGLVIVTTSSGGQREVVEEGLNGYLTPTGDVATLAGRLRTLAEMSADALAVMRDRNIRRAGDLFDIRAHARRFEAICQSLKNTLDAAMPHDPEAVEQLRDFVGGEVLSPPQRTQASTFVNLVAPLLIDAGRRQFEGSGFDAIVTELTAAAPGIRVDFKRDTSARDVSLMIVGPEHCYQDIREAMRLAVARRHMVDSRNRVAARRPDRSLGTCGVRDDGRSGRELPALAAAILSRRLPWADACIMKTLHRTTSWCRSGRGLRREQFHILVRRADRLPPRRLGRLDSECLAQGRKSVDRVDVQPRHSREVEASTPARTARDPRDGSAPRIVPAVLQRGPAVVGGYDQQRRVRESKLLEHVEHHSHRAVRLGQGGQLLLRSPAVLVARRVHAGQVQEQELRPVLSQDANRFRGHHVHVVHGLVRWQVNPIDASRPVERGELHLRGHHRRALVGLFQQFEDGRHLRVGILDHVVPRDLVHVGPDAGQHAYVRGQRVDERVRDGRRPQRVARLVEQPSNPRHVGAGQEVWAQPVDADQHRMLHLLGGGLRERCGRKQQQGQDRDENPQRHAAHSRHASPLTRACRHAGEAADA